jgi:DNA polymerase V
MTDSTTSGRGGSRFGSGRRHGTGHYGEPTQPIRVPVTLLPSVRALLSGKKRRSGDLHVLSVPDRPTALPLPLYGSRIAAGFPSPADDHLEDTLDLNEHLIRHPAATFFVKVQGDSMIKAGIHHGDTLVVDRSQEAKSGSVVIAVVNGELTVKRLKIEGGRVWLMPENPNYAPLEIKEGMELVIWGVVMHVIHSL